MAGIELALVGAPGIPESAILCRLRCYHIIVKMETRGERIGPPGVPSASDLWAGRWPILLTRRRKVIVSPIMKSRAPLMTHNGAVVTQLLRLRRIEDVVTQNWFLVSIMSISIYIKS